MKLSVNIEVAYTHLITRKKQTIIAALGATIGIAMYIFANSMMAGTDRYMTESMFKATPHYRIYQDDKISQPIVNTVNNRIETIIINPRITTTSKKINNPYKLLDEIRSLDFVTITTAQVPSDVFYYNGKSEIKGVANGVNIFESNAMFNILDDMIAGDLQSLSTDKNGIIIGSGIASKLSIGLNDNVTLTSARGVLKVMKVVGIFSTSNKTIDESKSYINISAAQQFLKKGPTFISNIYVNIIDYAHPEKYQSQIQALTSYKVENWKESDKGLLVGDNMRKIMGYVITVTILFVAAFGMYNILNMTIMQKINDIAILKAVGFGSKDIIQIFLAEAAVMGILGTLSGEFLGIIIVKILSMVYLGGPIGNFPITFEPTVIITALGLGLALAFGAGFFPALKASKVDPVEIFRR